MCKFRGRLQTIWPIGLLLITNGLILANVNPNGRYAAALIILAFLPGWVWLPTFIKPSRLDWLERVTLAIGLSLALTIIFTMYLVYLPDPLTTQRLLIASNVIIISGFIINLFSPELPTAPMPHRLLILFILIMLLAAVLRLPKLGYAEFHEDEAEALMLGVRLLQGENYAIFLHRKGPAQMLLPVAFWLLTNHITESMARFPFALCSILSVATLFFIGRRWFGWQIGLMAALLWAINGYAIAFGRMVQYQAIIFFLGPLAIYCFYLAHQYCQFRLQILGAILLATCLLAHFDALLLLPVAIWLSLPQKLAEIPTRLLSFLIFLIILDSFYMPYFRDPEFANTAAYLAESRVKPGLLYNNLNLLWQLDQIYSSRFYLPMVVLGIVSFIMFKPHRFLKPVRFWEVIFSLFLIILISTVWIPSWWRIGSLNLAILPWLIMGIACFWSAQTVELKAVWLMFGAPFIGYVFLVDDPRTHLYIIYPGAMLLAALGMSEIAQIKINFQFLSVHFTHQGQKIFITSLVGLLAIFVVAYEWVIFLQTESTLTSSQLTTTISKIQNLPKERGYFGYPKREGWKATGALRAQRLFLGDFRSVNEDFIVPIWYNYGQARSCYDTPAQFFVRTTEDKLSIPNQYYETGRIQREGETRLWILSDKRDEQLNNASYQLEDLETAFDELATPDHFIHQTEPTQTVGTQFGPAIRLTGYDLLTTTVTAGEILYLNLYWQATAKPSDDYRAFVHLTDGATILAQQDDNPACRLPTSVWRVGQRSMGQFRLTIKPNTPPADYPLIIGLYQAKTLTRLTITGGAGQPGDNFLWLKDITIPK